MGDVSLYDDHNHKEGLGDVEQILKDELNTTKLVPGNRSSGSVNDGLAYDTDQGTVFVKFNAKNEDGSLFEGEFEGLQALWNTHTLTVPKPIKYIKCPGGGSMLVLEYLDMIPIYGASFGKLGAQVARLHLHNGLLKARTERLENTVTQPRDGTSPENVDNQLSGESSVYVNKFGFDITTHCGYFPQNNSWMASWPDFFARKLEDHVTMTEKKFNCRESRPLFHQLVRVLPLLFRGLEIEPSLLHGDLWRGNIKQTDSGPVAFDPISLYGHSEFEISIAHCHKGFDPGYFDAYHKAIPKAQGFDDRLDLYLLHHYFQLWNHFGAQFNPRALREVEPETHMARFREGYDVSTLNQIRKILNKFEKPINI